MKLRRQRKEVRSVTDSVAYRQSELFRGKDTELLAYCASLWNNLDEFRKKRARAMRFTYGDQWADYINVKGKMMMQRDYLMQKGNVALQTNQIKKVVNTIAGVLVKENNEPVCHAIDRSEQQYGELMTMVLQANNAKNKMKILNINAVEEAVIGGLAVMRESYEWRNGRQDSWTDICNPNYIFFDSTMKDPRFWDMSLIGEIHDITFTELCAKFAKSADDIYALKDCYPENTPVKTEKTSEDMSDKNNERYVNFYTPHDISLCRVYEIWKKESKARYRVHDVNAGTLEIIDAGDREALSQIKRDNETRIKAGLAAGWDREEIPLIETEYFIDTFWYVRFITPDGKIIWEAESPYADRSHPYSICAVPFTDGKIVSVLSDAIDQNIAINRILTLDDWIRRAGAKGVTFVPEDLVPDTMSKEEFAEEFTSMDGLLFYKPKKGVEMPKQFFGQTSQLNTSEMVRMMNDLLESSVSTSGAIQGKTPLSGTSAALYAQQTANSSTPIATFLEKFRSFMDDVANKKLKYIAQFYTAPEYRKIASKTEGMLDNPDFNLNRVGDIEYDLIIRESAETPMYRMIANDWLMQMAQTGAVTFEDVLELGSLPFADKLLQKIQARKAEMEANPQMQQPIGDDYEAKKQMLLNA